MALNSVHMPHITFSNVYTKYIMFDPKKYIFGFKKLQLTRDFSLRSSQPPLRKTLTLTLTLTTERTPTLNIEWGQINPKVGGGCNIDSGQNDPKATQGLKQIITSLDKNDTAFLLTVNSARPIIIFMRYYFTN